MSKERIIMAADPQLALDSMLVELAKKFSAELNSTTHNHIDIVIPVKVWPDKSQYFGINELIGNPTKYFDENWYKILDYERYYCLGIALGRFYELHKSTGNFGNSNYIKEIIDHIISKDSKMLDILPEQGFSQQTEEIYKSLIVNPLCNISFKNSYLSGAFQKEPELCYFGLKKNVADTLTNVIKNDAEFHFGWECERFLFPDRDYFFYAFIDPQKINGDLTNEYILALCIWTRKPGVQASSFKRKLNTLLGKYCNELIVGEIKQYTYGNWKVSYDAFSNAMDIKKNVDAVKLLGDCDGLINHDNLGQPKTQKIISLFVKLKNESEKPGNSYVEIFEANMENISRSINEE